MYEYSPYLLLFLCFRSQGWDFIKYTVLTCAFYQSQCLCWWWLLYCLHNRQLPAQLRQRRALVYASAPSHRSGFYWPADGPRLQVPQQTWWPRSLRRSLHRGAFRPTHSSLTRAPSHPLSTRGESYSRHVEWTTSQSTWWISCASAGRPRHLRRNTSAFLNEVCDWVN